MADSESRHLIEIVVRALNRVGDLGQQIEREVGKATGAQEKHTKAVQDNEKAIDKAHREYNAFVKDVKAGRKDFDEAKLGLSRLAGEFDRLSRKQPVGSKISEDLNRVAITARNLVEQLKTARDTERKLEEQAVKDRIRHEEERQQITQKRIDEEVRAETRGVRARSALLGELLSALEADEKARVEHNRRINESELADDQRRTQARVAEAERAARLVADVARRADVEAARPSIGQRVRRFFGGSGDESGTRRFVSVLTDVGRASDGAEQRVSRLDRTLERLHGTTDRVGFSVAKVDNNLRGLLVVGVIAFSQQVISALLSLGATLFSVGSAAVQAGAAVGGAFVAAAAQAIPAIGLLVAAFGRIGAVFKAVQLFNKQATRQGRDQASAADAQAAAADRVVSAQEQVASAVQRVKDATDALTEARRKAIENIQDLELAERRANLTRFQSQQAIREAIATGDVGALEGLRISADEATLASRRTTRDARQARVQGVQGSDQVQQATRTLNDATVALGRARREQEAANRAAARAQENVGAADQALKEALAQLTPAERELYRAVRRIQDRFKVLFRPITDIIVRAFTDSVERVTKVLGDSRIIGAMRAIAEATADSIRLITRELTSSKWIEFFRATGREAARNIPLLTDIAIQVGRIFRAISTAAQPALRRFLEFIDKLVTGGAKATGKDSGVDRLSRFFLRGEEYAEKITKLTLAVIRLFATLAGAGAAETGANAIDQLTAQVNEATQWINENRDKVRQFFKDSLGAASSIASSLFKIAQAAAAVFDSKSVQDFASAFNDVLLPALTSTVKVLGAITSMLTQLLDLPVVRDLAAWGLTTGLLFKAFSTFGKLLGPFSVTIVRLLGNLPLIGRAFRALAIAIRFAGAVLSGPWGLAIAAAIAAIVLLDRKFHFLHPAVIGLAYIFKTVLGGALTFVRDVVKSTADAFLGLITTVLGGISSLATAGSHLPGVGGAFKDAAKWIDDARSKIDGFRESVRKWGEEKPEEKVVRLRKEVVDLKERLFTLKEGTDDYRKTAHQLQNRQDDLNKSMDEAERSGKRGARGPRAIGNSARSAASAVDAANRSITKGFNSLASQLGGIKKITYTTSGIDVKGGSGSITADTGDILLGRAMGGWIGRSCGPQGPDNRMVLAGDGEAFLNRPQQGPVEEGLALRSMLMGGPGNLSELFRMYGGAFAAGGRVGVDLKGAGDKLRRFAVDALRYGLHVSSGLRRGAITASGNPSLHGIGEALDLAGSARDMLRYAAHAVRAYGRQLAELIHTPLGFGIKGGRRVPLSFWGPTVNADHVGHVHLGYTGSGALGGVGVGGDLPRQRIRGPAGALRSLAQRAVDRIHRAADARLGEVNVGREIGPGGGVPANAAQIRRWITAGLELAGQRATRAAIQTLFGRIMQESGGNPLAINRTDINAQRGDPSIGILQTIGGTFRRYMVRGHGNIRNPVDNIAAAVRYMLATYGHLVGRGPGGYQAGGFVGGARRAYAPPTIINQSVGGVLAELRRATTAIGRLRTRGSHFLTYFARSIDEIVKDGGLIDQTTSAVQRVVDGMALRLRQATYRVTRSGVVVRRLDPAQQNLAQISSLDRQRAGLQGLQSGIEGILSDVNQRIGVVRRGGVTARERKAYQTLVAARRSLLAKLQDVEVAIADAVEARFNAQEQALNDVIDKIDKAASRKLARADLADRVATVLQSISPGLDQTAFALRGAALQSRSSALIAQRDQLGQAVGIANALGRQDLVPDLIARIEDLNVQLFENAAAIRANTTAARQAQIDAITSRGSFQGGVLSGLSSFIQTIGARTGALDVSRLQSIGQQAGASLQQTGDALRQQLAEAFGVDLRGLTGDRFAQTVQALNFDQIELSLTPDQRAQFESLISAIIDNAGAVEQNTQSLQELAQTQEQTFSSSLWQLFRRAVFTGSGGLLPQFQIPLMQTGGTVLSSGLIYAHRDERVVPAQVARDWSGGDTNNVYITTPTEVANPGYIAEVLSFRRSLGRATR